MCIFLVIYLFTPPGKKGKKGKKGKFWKKVKKFNRNS